MQTCEEGQCTQSDSCINEYNNQTNSFKRIYWGLQSVPCDIPQEVELLDLMGNNINVLGQNVFTGLEKCRFVNMQENNMITINQGAFNGMKNLIQLDLHTNSMKIIQKNMWTGLDKLQVLHLSWNKIARISSGNFEGLVSLSALFLTQNNIVFLEKGAFTGLQSLAELDLGRNNLASLDQEVFSELPRPLLFHAGITDTRWDHPYHCHLLCWLKQEEEQGTTVFGLYTVPRCASGTAWKDLRCNGT